MVWPMAFAPQPCRECRTLRDLSDLVPIHDPEGKLNGWRCAQDCVPDE